MATVAETLRARRADLTPAELRVAQALLADYPSAGLQSALGLAEAAGVSTPTVVRLMAKLGFPNWASVQSGLRAELSAKTAGPVQLYPTSRTGASVLERFEAALVPGLQRTLQTTDPVEFARAVELLADRSRSVLLAGGRVSGALADYLGRSLQVSRPDVRVVTPTASGRVLALLDVTRHTTVVVFDYRRYDHDTVTFGREAARLGAAVLLFTDPYLSPLSSSASVLLTSFVAGPPPFVSLASAMALVEAVTLGVVEAQRPKVRRRLQAFDRLSESGGLW